MGNRLKSDDRSLRRYDDNRVFLYTYLSSSYRIGRDVICDTYAAGWGLEHGEQSVMWITSIYDGTKANGNLVYLERAVIKDTVVTFLDRVTIATTTARRRNPNLHLVKAALPTGVSHGHTAPVTTAYNGSNSATSSTTVYIPSADRSGRRMRRLLLLHRVRHQYWRRS